MAALPPRGTVRPLKPEQVRQWLQERPKGAAICGAKVGERVCTREPDHWQGKLHYDVVALRSFTTRDPGPNPKLRGTLTYPEELR